MFLNRIVNNSANVGRWIDLINGNFVEKKSQIAQMLILFNSTKNQSYDEIKA